MKYSIFQFSQEKLLENSLDVIDALILSWFSDFFMTGMEKKVFKEDSGGKLYGWVKLSKVLEDIPCIGINSEKGIKRRFDGFVEKGIMTRQSVITQNGKKTYYRPTEIYDELVNTKTSSTEKTETKNQQEEKLPKTQEFSQGYFDSHAENKNPQGTKTTDANAENAQKSSHGYFHSHAQGNENILPQGHFDSHALNDSSTRDSLTTDAAMQTKIKEFSEKIFGKNAFDLSFPKKAADFFASKNLSGNEIQKYFEFVKIKTDSKNAENPRGLAYKLIFQADILQEFLDKQSELQNQEKSQIEKQQKLEEEKITCPCCKTRFLQNYENECPSCHFEIKDFADIPKIEKHKRFIKLPEAVQAKYIQELLSFRRDLNISQRIVYQSSEKGKAERAQFLLALDKKYKLIIQPAVETEGHIEYWRKGMLHRDNGEPAVYAEGFSVKEWWENNKRIK